jgi:hypothetical protein
LPRCPKFAACWSALAVLWPPPSAHCACFHSRQPGTPLLLLMHPQRPPSGNGKVTTITCSPIG